MTSRLLAILLLASACGNSATDTSSVAHDVVLVPPGFTLEVGELGTWEALLTGPTPERLEWYFDEDLAFFDGVAAGTERVAVELVTPAESFAAEVRSILNFVEAVDGRIIDAAPNTVPSLEIRSPMEASVPADTVVTLDALTADRTDGGLTCSWQVGGSEVRSGVPGEDGTFATVWTAVPGQWTLVIACEDRLGLASFMQRDLVVP